MIRIKILSPGKTKEAWLQEALQEYLKRLQPFAAIEFLVAKDDAQLLLFAQKESPYICLDSEGETFTSVEFADFLQSTLEQQGSRMSFIIGGPLGLPQALKKGPAISLSSMTFTHQMARLLLVEQIYRAFEIHKNSNYHK
jgi:23S rRNA (pseudouridine1915-N3)-methyltransferase